MVNVSASVAEIKHSGSASPPFGDELPPTLILPGEDLFRVSGGSPPV
jgi:hypothetical protein